MDLTIFLTSSLEDNHVLVEFCLFCEFVKFNGDIQIHFGREIPLSLSLISFRATFVCRAIDYSLVSPDLWTVWSKTVFFFLNNLLFPKFLFSSVTWVLSGKEGDK
jgi:hypothetical protein